jgi:hypothetical protein
MKIYIMDDDAFGKLSAISAALHSGTDSERDYGHKIWLLQDQMVCEEVKDELPASKPAESPKVGSYFFPRVFKLATEKGMRLHLDGCKIHMSQAGILSVVNPVFGQGYYGRFDDVGNFTPNRQCTDKVLDQLKDVEVNGVEAAKRIGLLTGTCCVCGRSLTNEGSIEAGIGPICAGKF